MQSKSVEFLSPVVDLILQEEERPRMMDMLLEVAADFQRVAGALVDELVK